MDLNNGQMFGKQVPQRKRLPHELLLGPVGMPGFLAPRPFQLSKSRLDANWSKNRIAGLDKLCKMTSLSGATRTPRFIPELPLLFLSS